MKGVSESSETSAVVLALADVKADTGASAAARPGDSLFLKTPNQRSAQLQSSPVKPRLGPKACNRKVSASRPATNGPSSRVRGARFDRFQVHVNGIRSGQCRLRRHENTCRSLETVEPGVCPATHSFAAAKASRCLAVVSVPRPLPCASPNDQPAHEDRPA